MQRNSHRLGLQICKRKARKRSQKIGFDFFLLTFYFIRRKLRYGLIACLTLLIAIVGYYPPALTQSPQLLFACDPTLYVSRGQPSELNRVQTFPSFALIPQGRTTVEYNAIGFNVRDGFIYGMAPQSVGQNPPVIYQIDITGNTRAIGSPAGFPIISADTPQTNAFAGDIDRNGNYFVYVTNVPAGQPNFFQIDLSTNTVVRSLTLANTNFADIAFNPVDDQLYAFQNPTNQNGQLQPGQVVRIDVTSGQVTPLGGVQPLTTVNPNTTAVPAIGAAFFDSFGNFFIYESNGREIGNIWVARNLINSDQVIFQGPTAVEPVTRFDGASCAFAPKMEKTVEPPTIAAGGIVTYRYRIANQNTASIPNLTFRDVMPDGRTFVAGTLTNPFGGTPNAFGGTSTLEITGFSLPARTEATISVQVRVPRTALPGTVFNQSTIGPVPTNNPNNPSLPSDYPVSPGFPDPTPLEITASPPTIGLAKTVASVVDLGNGNFQVTYNLAVENKGNVDLNSVQVTEDLSTSTFPSIPFTVNRVSSPSGNLTPNNNFDGRTNTNLLAGTDTLLVGERKTIELVVTITPGNNLGPYENQARATGQSPSGVPVEDTSNDGTNTDPDNDGDPTNNNVPTRLNLRQNPVLGVAKNVVSLVDAGGGNFTVTYTILARNLGDAPLRNLQLTENLSTTFGSTPFTVNRVSSPSANLAPNSNFNGVNDINLLSGTDELAVGETKTLELVVTFTPGNNIRTYENQVEGTATSPTGTPIRDQSTNGTTPDPDNDGNPTNNNIPTPVEPSTQPRLRLVKRITNVIRGGVPLGGINFNTVVDDPNDVSDRASGWFQLPGGGPLGLVQVSPQTLLQSGDEVEYTVYFLSDGGQPVTNVKVCDPVPEGTTFIPDSFQPGRGILLNQQATDTPLTNVSDTDQGTFFSRLAPVTSPCPNTNNPNGSVFLQLGELLNTAPNNVGFVRFRVTID